MRRDRAKRGKDECQKQDLKVPKARFFFKRGRRGKGEGGLRGRVERCECVMR